MFISTVVHLVEIILLSLLGIMFYKLFASYKKWKSLSVSSSSSKGGDRAPKLVTPATPQNPDYLSVSKITVSEENPQTGLVREKQSSVILKDYIGEFFAESNPVDLSPFRQAPSAPEPSVPESVIVASANEASALLDRTKQIQGGANQSVNSVCAEKAGTELHEQADDEFIQVKPVNLNPVILAQNRFASNNPAVEADETIIPTLNDLVDTDSDGYITVASGRHESRANNIMSDKVVLAMLDEAKLVCAS